MGKCFSLCIPSKPTISKKGFKGSLIEDQDTSEKNIDPLDSESLYVKKLQNLRVTTSRINKTSNTDIPTVMKTSDNKLKTQRIMKEILQLTKQLPVSSTNSIFLRYDESSIDKMQAIIIGRKIK